MDNHSKGKQKMRINKKISFHLKKSPITKDPPSAGNLILRPWIQFLIKIKLKSNQTNTSILFLKANPWGSKKLQTNRKKQKSEKKNLRGLITFSRMLKILKKTWSHSSKMNPIRMQNSKFFTVVKRIMA